MYNRLTEYEKQQYVNIMEELKDIQYKVRKLSRRKQLGIKQCILKKLHLYSDDEAWDEIPERVKTPANYFSEDRIVVYTCIIGNYDRIQEPVFVPDNCDFYIITDQTVAETSVWKKIDIADIDNIKGMSSPTLINRFIKMNPYELFENYRYSIYIDGNLRIITDLTEYVNRVSEYGISFFDHGARKCVYDEIQMCIDLKKAREEKLREFERYLKELNMPKEYGLLYGGVIVRDHENEKGRKISKAWWEAFLQFPMRDQILLPYVLFEKGILTEKLSTLGENLKSAYGIQRCKHKV